MAQAPAGGLWWRSGEGEWVDRIIEAGIAFEKEGEQKWEEMCKENVGHWSVLGGCYSSIWRPEIHHPHCTLVRVW